MTRTCIAIVDAAHARLFVFERAAQPDGLHETLDERRDLVNPARRLTPHQLFSDSRPGSSRVGTRGFAFDDHRDHAIDALDVAFARAVANELLALVHGAHATRAIVCASPHMLGMLRRTRSVLAATDVAIAELPRDLVKLSPHELRAQLGSYGFLPPRPARFGA